MDVVPLRETCDLEDFDSFYNFIKETRDRWLYQQFGRQERIWKEKPEVRQIYCPKCKDTRRVRISPVYSPLVDDREVAWSVRDELSREALVPSLFEYTCLECDTKFAAVIHNGPDQEPALTVIPGTESGAGTLHTPKAVGFYLDQAHRCQIVGANSAAAAMFRAALEQLLFHEEYTVRGLGAKIDKLEADVAGGSGPGWMSVVSADVLRAMKNIGNSAIHPNDGDVEKQERLDAEALRNAKAVFAFLCDVIYEAKHRQAALLDELRQTEEDLSGE